MFRFVCAIYMCLVAVHAFGQSASRYQAATITEVRVHQLASADGSNADSYDVSLQVGETIYQVLYTPTLATNAVRYAAGREVLVLIKEKTIRYNDLLGQSFELPIVGRRPAIKAK